MIDASYIEGLKTGLWIGCVVGVGAGCALGFFRCWQRRTANKSIDAKEM
jgi:hypothetical protein